LRDAATARRSCSEGADDVTTVQDVSEATQVTREDAERELEQRRPELTGYCYRMLGSSFDAQDAVQETMIRAWRAFDAFEGRSALRSWLYRIATNVCLDMVASRQRRALPMDLGAPQRSDSPIGTVLGEATWIEPIPDDAAVLLADDPANVAVSRDSIRLAFVAVLQHLPAKQRAVLILREVLQWKAAEVAELLDTSVASVNSALQRARATIAESDLDANPTNAMDTEQQAMLARYVDAFQRYDMESLTSLLHHDATQSMPPYAMWLRGREEILAFWQGTGAGCRGSHLIATTANGSPAFGQYRRGEHGFEPWALQVLEVSGGRIAAFTFFLDAERIFPMFGLPLHLSL
jgi:RNA polymerase sigma-70 factor (ECF subfamily)